MSKKVLVIAPHPDDETLGCGGTLLKHKNSGDEVYWFIATSMNESHGFNKEQIQRRQKEIETVSKLYRFKSVQSTKFPAAGLDQIAMSDLVEKFKSIINKVKPEVVYLPFRGDAHTDHAIVFDAASASLKWFRCKSVKRVLCYETLSETEVSIRPDQVHFRPNVFVDISKTFKKKLEVMNVYKSEVMAHPFPRSERTIRALAEVRGAASGCEFAEAFLLLWEKA